MFYRFGYQCFNSLVGDQPWTNWQSLLLFYRDFAHFPATFGQFSPDFVAIRVFFRNTLAASWMVEKFRKGLFQPQKLAYSKRNDYICSQKTRIKMKTFAIILLVLGGGYLLFLIFGVILCMTASPEEKKRLRREYKKQMQERQLRKYKRWLNRRLFWSDFFHSKDCGPGITD